jgi:hypothetical protein
VCESSAEYGPSLKTENATEMIDALNDLTAKGGEDIPELFYHGMLEALELVRSGSTCYAFTDAPPKDVEKKAEVEALTLQKKVRVGKVEKVTRVHVSNGTDTATSRQSTKPWRNPRLP